MEDTMIQKKDAKGKALAGFILGLVGLVGWIIPLIGAPVAIVGLIMSTLGVKSSKKTMAIIGIVLSVICLIATIVNGCLGAYSALQKIGAI